MATIASTDRDQLAKSYVAAWNSHDADAIAAFFTEHAVYDDRGAGEVARGRPAIRAHVANVLRAFPDLSFELVRSAHGEGFSAAEWTCRMTHRGALDGLGPTGREIESAGVDVATLAPDGATVTHLTSYYDGAEIMRALGVLPARHSRSERLLAQAASLAAKLPLPGR